MGRVMAHTKMQVFVVVCVIFTVAVIPILYRGPFQNPSLAQDTGLQGYMLAVRYSDQITGATTNVRSLMCLAKKIGGVQVVEPFVVGSRFGVNLTANWTKEVKMTDIFDYGAWKRSTPFNKYGKLVSFKTFLQNAPRKLLMVQYCHASFCHPCKHKDIVTQSRIFCELNHFELVGILCVNYKKKFSFLSINTVLYSNYSKADLVILFDLYGGIENSAYDLRTSYRLYANIKECSRRVVQSYSDLAPSRSVLSDADQYIQKYLNGSAYISVMIRMERVFRDAKVSETSHDGPKLAKQCFDNVLQTLKDIRKRTGLKEVFLTLDMGRYGSDILRRENLKAVEEHAEEFMSTVYGRNISLGEWEERCISTSKVKTPGYISVVQKQIAAKGEVLVLVGPGSSKYQKSTKALYEKLHKNKQVFTLSRKCRDTFFGI